MNFISLTFLGFLFLALIVYYAVPKRMQWGWLLTASLFFTCVSMSDIWHCWR